MTNNETLIQILQPALDAILKHENANGNEVWVTLMQGYSPCSKPKLTIDAWCMSERHTGSDLDDLIAKVASLTPEHIKQMEIDQLQAQIDALKAELAKLESAWTEPSRNPLQLQNFRLTRRGLSGYLGCVQRSNNRDIVSNMNTKLLLNMVHMRKSWSQRRGLDAMRVVTLYCESEVARRA